MQEKGFKWKLHYGGKIFPVVMHPFVPFIVGDTEGHDRLCGHYTARFSAIKQLCRVCECPTLLSGYSKAKFPHRKPKIINRLVRSGDLEGLKDMSQNYLSNGFNQVRFGQHNDRGIFGACPGEMLHLISLGWFKYCLEAFAAQAGAKSVALKQYDSLCAKIGRLLSRHSNRDLPRMNFPKGFSSGANLMGHEIAGCLLLVKLFALQTLRFRHIFRKNKMKASDDVPPEVQLLSNEKHIADWILVVSSLLQWHQWMKQSSIPKSKVRKSQLAVQWLMRKVAEVSPRASGMGNNTIKTHLVLHLCEDILDHGVPENVNSSYAESAHIPLAKITSRNTQKRATSFTKQAAHRYIENLAITLASSDFTNDLAAVSCGKSTPQAIDSPLLAGRGFSISIDSRDNTPQFAWNRKGPSDNPEKDHLSAESMRYITQNCVHHMPRSSVPCFTELVSEKGHRYRAHPNIYDGRPWNDHVMVKWGGHPHPLPAFIHAFLDLRQLPIGVSIRLPESGQTIRNAGVYALIHSFSLVEPEDMDYPNAMIARFTVTLQNNSKAPKLYLVDVATFDAPTIGIPDIGWSERMRTEQQYLFLFRRKVDWHTSWDAMIDECWQDRDSASVEETYEKPPPTNTEPPRKRSRR